MKDSERPEDGKAAKDHSVRRNPRSGNFPTGSYQDLFKGFDKTLLQHQRMMERLAPPLIDSGLLAATAALQNAITPSILGFNRQFSSLVINDWAKSFEALGASSRFIKSFEASRLLIDRSQGLTNAISAISRSIPSFNSMADQYLRIFEDLERQLRVRQKALFNDLRWTPTELFANTIASLQATLDVAPKTWTVSGAALRLPDSYLSFASGQFRRLARREAEEEQDVVLKVLNHATGIYAGTTATLESFGSADGVTPQTDAEEESEAQTQRHNVFRVLNQHCAPLYASRGASPLTIAETAPSVISGLGCQLVELVTQVNDAHPGEKPFTVSNRTLRAAALLPTTIATGEAVFADVIDHLNYLLCEGSNQAQRLAHLFAKEDPVLGPMVRVTRLRNYFRHDLEHGRESEVRRKLRRIHEDFHFLIGQSRPVSTADWKKAQSKLYGQLVEMLEIILRKTVSGP